jgi:hypothetical protein
MQLCQMNHNLREERPVLVVSLKRGKPSKRRSTPSSASRKPALKIGLESLMGLVSTKLKG